MSSDSVHFEDCVRHLLHCHRTCLGAAMTRCIEPGSEFALPQHLRLMLDCAALCQVTADALIRKSQFHMQLCDLCAEICVACAEGCEVIGGMEDCVISCRTCAESCHPTARMDHAAIMKMTQLPPTI